MHVKIDQSKLDKIEQAALLLQMLLSGLSHEEREAIRQIGFSRAEQKFLRHHCFLLIGFLRVFAGKKVGKPEKLERRFDAALHLNKKLK